MFRNARLFLLVTVALFVLAACSSKRVTSPRSEVVAQARSRGLEMPSPEQERETFFSYEQAQRERLMALIRQRADSTIRDANYRIGAGDDIELNVFDVPELNITAKVRQSGFISLPLVGAVQAAGLTEAEFHDQLAKRLADYVRQPQVSVFLSNYGSQKVAVMGAVAKPGTYPLKKGANSILELISEAGGVSEKAGNFLNFIPSEVSGVSADNDVEARARLALAASDVVTLKGSGIEIYLDQVLGTSGGIPLEIPVRGGDMIIVPEAGKVMVEGEVATPGSYELRPQMTLLGVLAAAGGITYAAKIDEVEVVRQANFNQKSRLVMSLEKLAIGEDGDVRLRNGDIVRVPSDSGRRLTQDTFEGITKIINFGIGGTVNLAN